VQDEAFAQKQWLQICVAGIIAWFVVGCTKNRFTIWIRTLFKFSDTR
jgi:hypothetical protein